MLSPGSPRWRTRTRAESRAPRDPSLTLGARVRLFTRAVPGWCPVVLEIPLSCLFPVPVPPLSSSCASHVRVRAPVRSRFGARTRTKRRTRTRTTDEDDGRTTTPPDRCSEYHQPPSVEARARRLCGPWRALREISDLFHMEIMKAWRGPTLHLRRHSPSHSPSPSPSQRPFASRQASSAPSKHALR